MVDVFEEVEEQLRTDRLKSIALKLAPWVGGALVLALLAALGVWGWQTWHEKNSAKASDAYASALEAMRAQDRPKATSLFQEVAKSDSKGYAALALMQEGGLKLEAGDEKAAVALFDQAAAKAPDPIIGDLARLKAALTLLDTAPVPALTERLKPLTEDGRPYKVQAQEALAFAKLRAGDMPGARSDFVVLSLLADAPESTRQRARGAMELIDSGGAKILPEAVKASMAPQPVPLLPEGLLPGPPSGPQPQ